VARGKRDISRDEILQAFAGDDGTRSPPILPPAQLAQVSVKTLYDWLAKGRLAWSYHPSTLLDEDAGGDEVLGSILAAAGTSSAIEKISRYRRQHERAFLRSLTAPRGAKSLAASAAQPAFSSKDACEEYLVARLRDGEFRRPRCGGQEGRWIASRRVWQCQACRRQTGKIGLSRRRRSHRPEFSNTEV
jgi:hypothetical protein